jgi:hypothetical protein
MKKERRMNGHPMKRVRRDARVGKSVAVVAVDWYQPKLTGVL